MSPQQLAACYQVGQWQYCPEEVWPYLRPGLQGPAGPSGPAGELLAALSGWLHQRVEPTPELPAAWPHSWRSPAETLWQGGGDSAERALVLWSAAPLLGLPRGQLAVGLVAGRPSAWVEFPTLDLLLDPSGPLLGLRAAGAHRDVRLTILPPLSVALRETGVGWEARGSAVWSS